MALLDSHYPLGQHNTFRFEATARYAAHVRTPKDIPAALADPRVQGLPVLVLGGGSNVVLTRDFDGLVLLMEIPGITTAGRRSMVAKSTPLPQAAVSRGTAWSHTPSPMACLDWKISR